ncbi:LOW QUALITY PROTEIN: hypothetical protein HID58_002268, partial [Brassica napus]
VASTKLHPLTRSFFFQVNFRFDPGCLTFLLLKCVKESFLNQLSSEDNHRYIVICIVLVFFWKCSLDNDQQMISLGETFLYTATLSWHCKIGCWTLHTNQFLIVISELVSRECLTLVVEVGLKCCEESPASEHGIRVNVCQGEVLSSQMRSQKLKSFCFFF